MLYAAQLAGLKNRRKIRGKVAAPERTGNFRLPLFLTCAHLPLGLLLYNSSALAILHPAGVFLLGLYYAARKGEKIEKTAMTAAYLVGAEVLWRMAKSPIPWEFGKYSAAAIMILALVRQGSWKIPKWPLLYFAFLLPACVLTLLSNSLGDSRDKISFNLSGPFLVLVSCWFLSHLKLNPAQIKRLLLMIVVPLVSVASTTLFYTVTIEEISFGTESNFATSGGFGPNQVSSMLGLGVFLCLSLYLVFQNKLQEQMYLFILALLFAAQSVLTFSRGGMYNAVGGLGFVVAFQLFNPVQGIKRLLPFVLVAVVFLLLVFPFINDFTGGALQTRFEDTEATGREEIIQADFQIFTENPLLGVGVGEAKQARADALGKEVGSHTEFARVLSEHGFLGILALGALGIGAVSCLLHQKDLGGKALAAGAIVWSSLFMMNAGMRLAAPSFIWALSFLTVSLSKRDPDNRQSFQINKLSDRRPQNVDAARNV